MSTMSRHITSERATGIEPAFSAWEADVLPLNYTRDARDCTALDLGVSAEIGQRTVPTAT